MAKIITSIVILLNLQFIQCIEEAAVQKALFDNLLIQFQKSYSSQEEYDNRLTVFKQNLKRYEEMNKAEAAAGGTAVHGPNKFFDLTPEQFQTTYLTGYVKQKSAAVIPSAV
jgi:hypothetical protein